MRLKYLKITIVTILIVMVAQNFLYAQNKSQKNEQEVSEGIQDIKSLSKEAFRKELLELMCDEQKKAQEEIQGLKALKKEFKERRSTLKDQAKKLYSDFTNFNKDQKVIQESKELRSIQKRVVEIEIDELCNDYLAFCVNHKYYPRIIQRYQILVDALNCYGNTVKAKELKLKELEKLQNLVILNVRYAKTYRNHISLLGEQDILKYKIKLLNSQHRSSQNQYVHSHKENFCKRLYAKQELLKTDDVYLNSINNSIKRLIDDLELSIKGLSNNIYDKISR